MKGKGMDGVFFVCPFIWFVQLIFNASPHTSRRVVEILSAWGGPPRPPAYATGAERAAFSRDDGSIHSQRASQLVVAVINVAIILAFSLTPYIDWAAHVGGLIGGALLGAWFFAPSCASLLSTPRSKSGAAWAGLGTFIALLGMAIALLYGGAVQVEPVLLDVCGWWAVSYPQYNLRCPW